MNKLSFLFSVFLVEARQRHFILKSVALGTLYLFIALILFEFMLYQNVLSQTYGIAIKLKVILLIFLDSFETLGARDSLLLIIVSLLFGVNLELVLRKLKFLKDHGNLHITIGAGLISLFSAGCAACGLSFASVIGIASVVTLLPFHGLFLFLLSILILLVSLLYNLNTLVKVCKIKT